MDPRGSHYKKGRAGHVRNINPYAIYRQRMKKWKYPFVATGVLLLFFLSFETAGEFSKTDVLSAFREETKPLFTEKNLEFGKKTLLKFLKQEIYACKLLKLTECEMQGKSLMHEVANIASPKDAKRILTEVEMYLLDFNPLVTKKICEKAVSENREKLQRNAEQFFRALEAHVEKNRTRSLKKLGEDLQNTLRGLDASSFCQS